MKKLLVMGLLYLNTSYAQQVEEHKTCIYIQEEFLAQMSASERLVPGSIFVVVKKNGSREIVISPPNAPKRPAFQSAKPERETQFRTEESRFEKGKKQ